MGTVEKRDKHKKRRFVSPEEKLERELKDCMHCRFFWGHNNRCANGTCCKPSKKKEQKPFKCDVTGNDKNYGFNVVNVNSTELVVFEAAIDLMSYVDIFTDYESNKLALGMLADAPLETFLREHPQITSIRFCLDGDEPGRKAAAELMRKYYELGYEVEDCPPPAGYKDYNEWLVAAKLNLNRMNKRADEPVRA